MTTPAVILVRPQLGINIGLTARAMLNFGLTDLRLVSPRDGWPNPEAGPAAAGADQLLDTAQIFDNVEAAISDLNLVFATSKRNRDMMKRIVSPERAVQESRARMAQGGQVGILFGPERAGLENDDLTRADAVLAIPVNPKFGSLNLSQAVILVAYEWFKSGADMPPSQLKGDYKGPAQKADILGLIAQLEAALDEIEYYYPPARAETMRHNLRNILMRADFTLQEVQSLRGVVKALAGKKPRRPLT